MTEVYKCPRCQRDFVALDARAKSYTCYGRDCNFFVRGDETAEAYGFSRKDLKDSEGRQS